MSHPRKILIIDDNRDIHADFRKVLCADFGHDQELDALEADLFGQAAKEPRAASSSPLIIDSAYQGEDGIEMALAAARAGEPYSMAFVDVRMPPGLDGIQTIKQLWQHLPDLQCVICTAFSDYDWEQITAELKNCCNLLILKKPFDSVEALQIAQSLTEKAALIKRNAEYRDQLEEKIRTLTETDGELRRQSELLDKSRAAAEAANRAKSDFIANISHELRTPLNGVIGMADLLLYTKLDERQQKYARTTKASAQLLLELLNELLDFSKIESGRFELDEIEFDLLESVETMIDVISHRCREKGLELAAFIDPQTRRRLIGDPGRIRQILMNLANNAVKFTEHGEVVVQVNVQAESADNLTVHFTVSDSGIGIPANCHDRLFQVFTQADSSTTRKYGGTGLGLAISKQLCELMGGTIGFDSELGKGSTFWFTLELGRTPEESINHSLEDKTRGIRVLIVDDNHASRSVLQKQLKAWGFEADTAESGSVALKMLRDAISTDMPYRIALVDLEMPEMSGEQFGEMVHASEELSAIKMIMMAPLDHAVDIGLLQACGFSDRIPKPVMLSDLLNALMRATTAIDCGGVAVEWHEQKRTPHVQALPKAKTSQARILIAEDNRVNQELAVEILTMSGYQCEVVPNGLLAVEHVMSDVYDLVLMDMQMPEMDGVEAAKAIRRGSPDTATRIRDIPIIALTANAMKQDRDKCLDAGMNDYLSKPLNPMELLDKIERLLEKVRCGSDESSDNGSEKLVCKASTSPADITQCTDSRPPIDWDSFVRRCMNNRGFAERLLRTFLSELPEQITALSEAAAARDSDLLSRRAHMLKGSAASASATILQEIANRLETLAHSEDWQATADQIAALSVQYDRLQNHAASLAVAS
jgi:two-component system, sensor histidine kinase and response regulator